MKTMLPRNFDDRQKLKCDDSYDIFISAHSRSPPITTNHLPIIPIMHFQSPPNHLHNKHGAAFGKHVTYSPCQCFLAPPISSFFPLPPIWRRSGIVWSSRVASCRVVSRRLVSFHLVSRLVSCRVVSPRLSRLVSSRLA